MKFSPIHHPLCLTFTLVLASLSFAETVPQLGGLHGPVQNVAVSFTPEGEDSRIVESKEYDRRGNCVERTVYEKGVNSRTESAYNSANHKIEESVFNGSDRRISRQTWKYDLAERMVERKHFDGEGQMVLVETWTYNSAGRLLKEERTSPKRPQENGVIRHEYDGTGKPVAEFRYDYKNIPFKKRIYIYRKNGELRREVVFKIWELKGRLTETILENHAYDKAGRLIETTLFLPEGDFWRRWAYRYDAKGKKTEETLYLKVGEVENRWLYRYDLENGELTESRYEKNGRTLLIKTHSNQGNNARSRQGEAVRPILSQSWEYEDQKDAFGNWIHKTVTKNSVSGEEPKTVGVYTRTIKYFKTKSPFLVKRD